MTTPQILIENIGDVTADVVFPQCELAMAPPEPEPSRLVIRDIGQDPKSFITGSRVTVHLGDFTPPDVDPGFFLEPFSTPSGSGWPGWTPFDPTELNGATVDLSVAAGLGRYDFTWQDASGPGFSNSFQQIERPIPEGAVGAVEWTYRAIIQIPEPDTYTLGRLTLSVGAIGVQIEIGNYNPTLIHRYQLFTHSSFPSEFTSGWDGSRQIVEITHAEDGTTEFRIWPEAGSRPSTPTLSATDTSPIDRQTIYSDAAFGSGTVSINQGDAGSAAITIDSIRLDYTPVYAPALDTSTTNDPFTRSVDPGIDGSPTFPYEWTDRDTSYDDLASSGFHVDGSKVIMPGGFNFDSYIIGWNQPPKKHSQASFDFEVPVLAADDGYFPSMILRLGWPDSLAGVTLAVEGDDDFGTVSDPHYRVGSAEGDGLNWVAGRYASVAVEPGNAYTAKVEYDQVKLRAKYKLWKIGDPEPDWQVECVINNPTDYNDCWIDFWDTSSEVDSWFDNLRMPAEQVGEDPPVPPAGGDTDVVPLWSGYLIRAARRFWFDVDKPDTMQRQWVLLLADINLLFQKRVVFKQSSPKTVIGPTYRDPTYDDDIINDLLDGWLDLSADDLDTASLVDRVAIVNPSSETCDPAAQNFNGWNASMLWGEAMTVISQVPAAIFGLIPGAPLGASPFGRLYYCDVDSADAPMILADRPGPGRVGYKEMTIWEDGSDLVNDDMAWGAGKGSDSMVFDRRTDSDSIDEHGLWQQGDVLFNIWCQDTIEKVTDAIVNGSPTSHRGHKDDILTIVLVTHEDGFRVGQKVRFINEGYDVDEVVPIRKSVVTFPTQTSRQYALVLSETLDRWGFQDPPLPFPTYRGPWDPGTIILVQPPPPNPDCWNNTTGEDRLDTFNGRNATILTEDDLGCTTFPVIGGYKYFVSGGGDPGTAIGGSGGGWPTVSPRHDNFVLDGQLGIFLPEDYRQSSASARLTLPISSTEDDIVIEFDAFITQATFNEFEGVEDGVGADMLAMLGIGFSGLSVFMGEESGPYHHIPGVDGGDFYQQRTFLDVEPLTDMDDIDLGGGEYISTNHTWIGAHGNFAAVHVKLESHRFSTTQKTVKITAGATAIQETLDYDDNHFSPQDLFFSFSIIGGLQSDGDSSPHDLTPYPAGDFRVKIDNLNIRTISGTCDVVPRCEE